MRFSHLRVVNYRGLRDVSIPLSHFVCITGENNGGKSSVLQALSLFLSGSSLKSSDYFDPTQEITISVKIAEIGEEDMRLLDDTHRERIGEVLKDQCLTLVRRYGTDGKSQLGYMGALPRNVRFGDEKVDQLVSGKKGAELKRDVVEAFPEFADRESEITSQSAAKTLIRELGSSLPESAKEIRFRPLPTGLDRSIYPMLPERIYIPAVKDLADDTKTAETSSFGKILAIVLKQIEPLLLEEEGLFEKLSEKLTRVVATDGTTHDNRLALLRTIEQTIQRYVRESFAEVKLEIDIPPPELKSILSTARILADDGMRGPLDLKGDGLRRAVVFSILRTYVDLSRRNQDGKNVEDGSEEATERGYLLLFEEPELFLHPDAQKILFEALGEFSKQHHVVVTTHSPLFLGPDATATFVRLSKVRSDGIQKPFTRAFPVDLGDIGPKDEFQIICYENNNAAFFAKRIVLVEGDSDLIVFPHIAKTLNGNWNCRAKSVAFVRVSGKGSIARYRRFFSRFDVPVYVIADLDIFVEGFGKLEPAPSAVALHSSLIQAIDRVNATIETSDTVKSDSIKKSQSSPDLRQLWKQVQTARTVFEANPADFPILEQAIDAFFAWEKKNVRLNSLQRAEEVGIREAKLALIWELRKQGIFILERGALEDYYPETVTGADKPSKAQSFCEVCGDRNNLLSLSPEQTNPDTGRIMSEFEFVCSAIFG